jgi:hypothetical protein
LPASWHARSSPRPTGRDATSGDDTGTVVVGEDHVRVDLMLGTYTPVLIDAGFPDFDLPVPWWGGRRLRFGFPPR